MVLASHVIFSTYGFWLPNDPRGSWSEFVGSWDLFRMAGRTTRLCDTRSQAALPHDHDQRAHGKFVLPRAPVSFSGIQAHAVGTAFAAAVRQHDISVWACSILPEHVHMVIGRHGIPVEQLVIALKRASTRELLRRRIHPFQHLADSGGRVPNVWARGAWRAFLDSWDDVELAVQYVEENPLKEGKPPQRWSFVRRPV